METTKINAKMEDITNLQRANNAMDFNFCQFANYQVSQVMPPKAMEKENSLDKINNFFALSRRLALSCALINIPIDGGTSYDSMPDSLAQFEWENSFSGWVQRIINKEIMADSVLAMQMMTRRCNMKMLLDEFDDMPNKRSGFQEKNDEQKECLTKCDAIAYGLAVSVREALDKLAIPVEKSTANVQGFGDVSQLTIRWLSKFGVRVVGITCPSMQSHKSWYIRKPSGINIDKLLSISHENQKVNLAKAKALGYEILPEEQWIEENVDALVSFGGSKQSIHLNNIDRIASEVTILTEGTPGYIASDAYDQLKKMGILVIPDFLATAGGTVHSFYKSVRLGMNTDPDKEELMAKIENKISIAFNEAYSLSFRKNLSMHDAVYIIGRNRLFSKEKRVKMSQNTPPKPWYYN